jgi:molybdopterin molybdotransferase
MLVPGAAVKIMTGAPLPPGADTVVQVEATEMAGDDVVLSAPVVAGINVRPAAEDVRRGDLLLSAGDVISAANLGVLASAGLARVEVARRPRVAILATGSELVPVDGFPGAGQIRNSNSFTAYGQALDAGAEPVLLGIARDDAEVTRTLLRRALEEDVVVTSGGVSVGDYDFVKQVQEELGVERRFWGVRTKPGKPLAFGVHGETPVFGVPGNPVAAMVTFEVFIRPLLLSMLGRSLVWRPWVWAAAAEPVRRTTDRPELRRCLVHRREERWVFTTTGPQGSGILSSMAVATGLVLVPTGFEGADTGEPLPVMLLSGSSDERPPFPE